ncbi:ATP-binding protein [Actinomadura sp. KC216]|uniref:FtsK/SpoIIIE domain-containing protein n=1 Tax=Actinomadura sp. KC216 TaxID=2530370 RepID=UPI001050A9D3|nr:FtsK/SpoIIIE domain-containing protein [Actinomadura sp. KC216]TDB84488.1 ATP-binding protein [Actinomadura sp. KC216]
MNTSDTSKTGKAGELATVHRLPLDDPGQSDQPGEPGVVSGRVLTAAEYARLTSQREQAFERWRGYRSDAVWLANAVRRLAADDRTKFVARQVMFVPVGAGVVARRVWEAKTNSRYERMMRAAEAAGDFEAVAEWEARAVAERQRRHQRVMDWITHPVQIAKTAVVSVATGVGGLLGLGVVLAVAEHDPAQVNDPLMAAVAVVHGTAVAVETAWAPTMAVAPWLVAAWLWNEGRRRAPALSWLAPQQDTAGEPVTPGRVVLALRDLGIPALRKAITDAGEAAASWLSVIRIAGCGVEVDVTLPSGVSTAEIKAKRRKLAENLDRHEHELHITIPPAARTVRLWVADSGALDEPIGPSPLVTDQTLTADIHSGRAPWGQDLRGDAVTIPLWQRHLLVTGLSNQGKTAALRALALWAALDRSVEFRIADLKGVGDWRMFEGIATTLIQGPTDEHVIRATHMLEDGVAEMERRLTALEESGATDGITREMSREPGSGFHPLVLIVDEAQQAFMCPVVGGDRRPYGGTKHTSRYFMAARKLHNQGRAVNVILQQGTQDPTDQNLPKLVREGAHIRASLVVGTEAQAKMALGERAVNAGAAPHELRQGLDKGTLVVSGDGVPVPAGQSSLTVRTHFISGEDANQIAERARKLRGPITTNGAAQAAPVRDFLADLDQVIRGAKRERTEIIRQRLAELDPAAYEGWSAQDLAARLADHGITITKYAGNKVVRADHIRREVGD